VHPFDSHVVKVTRERQTGMNKQTPKPAGAETDSAPAEFGPWVDRSNKNQRTYSLIAGSQQHGKAATPRTGDNIDLIQISGFDETLQPLGLCTHAAVCTA